MCVCVCVCVCERERERERERDKIESDKKVGRYQLETVAETDTVRGVNGRFKI